ncbi:hypothetical protein QFC22_005890 [Naganishia vaughanmartiniae]|uniref:Uncharacterized protein n=1 Tax=Naganishia vaughanmartiniae TaxID=1424756 RepID=A0ACC2WQK8_9TREE|nr:hypothetical protein QFC22_005890 [Naganishia vaughanmartiniae]
MANDPLPYGRREIDLAYANQKFILPKTLESYNSRPYDRTRNEEVTRICQLRTELRILLRNALRSLQNQNAQETPVFFNFINAARQRQSFSIRAALRLSFNKTAEADLVDFLLSPFEQGFRLAKCYEYTTENELIRSIILTTAQANTLLAPRHVGARTGAMLQAAADLCSSMRLWTYDYVGIPIVKQYTHAPNEAQSPNTFDHCYFIIVAGLTERVQPKFIWGDPMLLQPTVDHDVPGERADVFLNHTRCGQFTNPHLKLSQFRERLFRTINQVHPAGPAREPLHEQTFFPSVVRIDPYRYHGNGVAMCMGLVKCMQAPKTYFDLPIVNPNASSAVVGPLHYSPTSVYQELCDRQDGRFHRVGKAILVSFSKVIEAARRLEPPSRNPDPPTSPEDFDQHPEPEVSENEVNTFLWVLLRTHSWLSILQLERERRLDMLFYVSYKEAV